MRGVNKNDGTTLAVGSVTNAMRGRSLLLQNGISAEIGRSRPNEQTGCGYTLRIMGDAERAERLLRTAGIRVRSVL